MTAKEWLSRARNIDIEIKLLKQLKEEIFTELTHCTLPTDIERVDGSKKYNEQKKIKYMELCEQIEKMELRLIAVKTEIIKAIDNVPDSVSRIILYERYINLKKWYQISRIVNYDDKYIIKCLHKKALGYIEKSEELSL